ncbi:hypothetical protein [Gemmatimonas sp.]|uniref:hypothetical protein n=1 Tax=Gemmatimonas sp. TaxID=1962908 RepID=UPI0025C0C882|nr:hypothetical protein [Gemmatimonas sp.]MCA2990017.1 hypothetical protein [Gemmatimonas sp.]
MLREIPRYHCTTEGAAAHPDGQYVRFDDYVDHVADVVQERETYRTRAEEAEVRADRVTAENAALRVALAVHPNQAVARQLSAVLRLAATLATNNAQYDPQAGTVSIVPTDSRRELGALAVALHRLRVAEAAMTDRGTLEIAAEPKTTPAKARGR